MNIIVKSIKHFNVITKHRWYVFKYSIKAGIPIRGLLHDLSKYSITEFKESAKYYDGHRSPTHLAKLDKGYTEAWLHHKGRNKHHFEYWEDITSKDGEHYGAFMPYKYIVESVCDRISAGMTYQGKSWTKEEPLLYWKNIERDSPIAKHPGSVEFLDKVLGKIADDGLSTLNPKYLKATYKEIYNKYFKEK